MDYLLFHREHTPRALLNLGGIANVTLVTESIEEVFAFEAKRPEALGDVTPFSFYPAWMTDPRKPIPADPRFENLRAERIFDVEILKCIDGRTTIEDLVVILASQYGLAEDRCRATVERFFARWFEDEGAAGR